MKEQSYAKQGAQLIQCFCANKKVIPGDEGIRGSPLTGAEAAQILYAELGNRFSNLFSNRFSSLTTGPPHTQLPNPAPRQRTSPGPSAVPGKK